MEYFIKNSLILRYIAKSLIYIYDKYLESATHGFIKSFSQIIKNYFSHSKIWAYLKGTDYLHALWLNSMACVFLEKLLNAPSIFFRKIYKKHEEIFAHSYGFKILSIILENFELVIGLTLILTMIIPDNRWYNKYGVLFTLLLTLLYFIKTVIQPSESINIKDFEFSFIIFMVAITMATVTSLFPTDSINYFIYYLVSFITMIIIVSSVKTIEDLNKIVELIIIGVFLTALYGIWQWKVVGIEVNPSLTDIKVNQGMSGRVFSTMGNPNIYGELLVLTIPFFAAMVLNARPWWKKLLFAGLLLPVIVILLMTGSRSAWIAFAFSVFIFVFFKNKKLLPFMIIAGIFALPLLPPSIYRRFLTIFNPNDTSVKYRQQILEPAMPMLRNYWFTGVGLGNQVFNTIYKRYKSFALKTVAHTHNLYLQIWLEAGLAAILSFLWLVFRIVKRSSISIFSKKDDSINNILIAGVSSIGGLMLMGFADHVWFYNRILFMFWIVVSLVFAAFKLLNMKTEA